MTDFIKSWPTSPNIEYNEISQIASQLQEKNFNDYDQLRIQQKESKQHKKKKIRCSIKEISSSFYKTPSNQNEFVLKGDLLIKIRENKSNYDYNDFVNICNLFLAKKRIQQAYYDKINNLIEMESSNVSTGITNYEYIKFLLFNSQDQYNYTLANQLDQYEYNSQEANIQYLRLFSENEESQILKIQQEFYQSMRQSLISFTKLEDSSFYTYQFYSYIDKNEMGFPIQKYQGISEAASAIFGFEVDQLVEIIQKYGFFEILIIDCFSKELTEQRSLKQMMLLQYMDQLTQQQDIFDKNTYLITLDGIHIRVRLIIKQATQKINGTVISTFTYTVFKFDESELEKLIKIRSQKIINNQQQNVVQNIINFHPQTQSGNQFAEYISNHKNFKPPNLQDLFPEKTCRYKILPTNLTSL